MVGIFSRFSGGRSGHRRAKSALEVGQTVAPHAEVSGSVPLTAAHGIEVAVEIKPVEHPIEPLNHDQPVKCPLPEPSILNDARIWKERISSANARMRTDLPVVKEGSHLESKAGGMKPRLDPPRRAILPSMSAPEHNIITLLEECCAAENQTAESQATTFVDPPSIRWNQLSFPFHLNFVLYFSMPLPVPMVPSLLAASSSTAAPTMMRRKY